MKFNIVSPSKAIVLDYTDDDIEFLTKELSYKHTGNQFLLKKHAKNRWFKSKNLEAWTKRYEELKKSIDNTLLFNENGQYFIRPGSLPYLNIPNEDIKNSIEYPKVKKFAWAKTLPFELRPYQSESVERLIEAKHGAVSLCTGSGKSAIILKLLRELGTDAVVVVPSKSIFLELLEKAEYYLGRKLVGGYGNGKKDITKKITIAISDSLVLLKPDTPAYDFFKNKKVFISDESHTLPAETLEAVCHGVLSEVPYRFFLSGTQTRGDGTVKLLESITGPILYTLTTEDAINKGYICDHDYTIVEVLSSNPNYNSSDALEMKRVHLLRNYNIAKFVAKLANANAMVHGKQTLILVEELVQISMLLPLLKVPYVYAHSESKLDKLRELRLEKVNTKESVEKFNKNEAKVLIGTSCIATGTNIYPTHVTVNWVGGSSEIKTKQGAIGRSVRLHNQNPWQERCMEKSTSKIFDFDVLDIYVLQKHLDDRISYYRDSGTNINYIRLK